MWDHASVWKSIDELAARHGLSASGLAKRAGLDPTAFNPSKRHGADGRPRWPSTESVSKILTATGETVQSFIGATGRAKAAAAASIAARGRDLRPVPLLGFAQAGAGGFFDDAGFPAGQGWDEIALPGFADEGAYALKVAGESMMPAYRHGDILIVSPAAKLRRGDRVVVRTAEGEVMAKILKRRTAAAIELASLNPDHEDRSVPARDVDWMARILWASQ